jgi:DNA polymerase IV
LANVTQANTDKAEYFTRLYGLTNESDDDEDVSDEEASDFFSKRIRPPSLHMLQIEGVSETTVAPTITTSIANPNRTPQPLRRADTAPVHSTIMDTPLLSTTPGSECDTRISTGGQSVVIDTPLAQRLLHQRLTAQRRTVSDPISSANTSPPGSVIGKRKRRGPPITLVPEVQQIFRGVTFFYVPNDDKDPVRRLRITRALERGAVWTQSFTDSTTHIVVSKDLVLRDVQKCLNLSSIPRHAILVSETYLPECIQFKAVLDHEQKQYKVKGDIEQPEDQSQEAVPSESSHQFLQLKDAQLKPGKWDYFPLRGTPPRSGSTAERTSLSEDRNVVSSPDVWLNTIEVLEQLQEPDAVGSNLKESNQWQSRSLNAFPAGGDVLDDIIREALKTKHLPLDDEDEDSAPSRGSLTGSGESDREEKLSFTLKVPKPTKTKYARGRAFNQDSFGCMKENIGISSASNPNSRTIEILKAMANHYTSTKDTWRSTAYRKAITELERQPTKITTYEEAIEIPTIGHRLALKIEEIVRTDHLRRLESAKAEPGDLILKDFLNIYGVGYSLASRLVQQGYKTRNELTAAHEAGTLKFTDNQLLGLARYDDLVTRIPRDEVSALAAVVKNAAFVIDPVVDIIVGGSYRRGAAESGDIDLIVTKHGTNESTEILGFLHLLISNLHADGFLVAELATPRSESGSKWHGCCVLPGLKGPWRRIDFLLVPESELGAALIYFTGNDIFNRSMRLLASKKGMRLNQRGLYRDVIRAPGRLKVTEGSLIEGANEKKIFAALGVPWRPPAHRIC